MTGSCVILLTSDNLVLYLKRGPGGDHVGEWCFPGGTTEEGESPSETAKRECVEEIGSLPEGELQRIYDEDGFTTFLLEIEEHFVPKLNEEHTGYAWAPYDDPPGPLHEGCAAALMCITIDNLPAEDDDARYTYNVGDLELYDKDGNRINLVSPPPAEETEEDIEVIDDAVCAPARVRVDFYPVD